MVSKYVGKNSSGGATTRTDKSGIICEIMLNQQLAKALHKPIIKIFEKRKTYSSFKDNIWSADLACMQLISKL